MREVVRRLPKPAVFRIHPDVIGSVPAASLAAFQTLLDELKEIATEKGRIFSTVVHNKGTTHCFVTTSKEIHLFLGALTETGRECLAEFLEVAFMSIRSSQLLLSLEVDEGREGKDAIFVTRQPEIIGRAEPVTFCLAPARR